MAVKKANNKDLNIDTELVNTNADNKEVVEETVEEVKEESLVDRVAVDETPIDIREQAEAKPCKVKLREDHKCWLNEECYEFKKGQTYNVPSSIKFRLNKAGLLLPLN